MDNEVIKRLDQSFEDLREIETSKRREYIIEVGFKGSRKAYFENPKAIPLRVGEHVIVSYDNGEDMGVVNSIVSEAIKKNNVNIESTIIRKGNQIDLRRLRENRSIEDKILIDARKQAKNHGLEMKFIDIEYKFDRKKLVFYFTAEGRVDFRELVKTFASEYRTRIELRQIGVRDEAQRIGGIGICGKELCCSQFLTNFVSINVSMARDQNLFVKPEKFSGVCGKLLCCLKYEHNFYVEQKQGIPDIGTILITPKGKATITMIDVFRKTITLVYENRDMVEMPKDKFIELISSLTEEQVIFNINSCDTNLDFENLPDHVNLVDEIMKLQTKQEKPENSQDEAKKDEVKLKSLEDILPQNDKLNDEFAEVLKQSSGEEVADRTADVKRNDKFRKDNKKHSQGNKKNFDRKKSYNNSGSKDNGNGKKEFKRSTGPKDNEGKRSNRKPDSRNNRYNKNSKNNSFAQKKTVK